MRVTVLGVALRIVSMVWLLGVPSLALAQANREGTPPRTTDGQPNVQGVWTNFDLTPFETPSEIDIERLAPLARWFPGINQPPRPPAEPDPNERVEADPRDLLMNRQNIDGPGRRSERRRSMVVDPEDGRMPVKDSAVAFRNNRLINLTDTWMNQTPWERCITRGVPGSIFPGGYSAALRILQSPGYVVILYEMIHEARIIPIDGRPHPDESVRLWNGDSRGRWEGNTLVVEVANYSDKGVISNNAGTRGARGLPVSEDLHIVERFTLAEAGRIDYELTIEDPEHYTAPWTVAMPLNKDDTYDLFEYACHEGNYGMALALGGARSDELSAASAP